MLCFFMQKEQLQFNMANLKSKCPTNLKSTGNSFDSYSYYKHIFVLVKISFGTIVQGQMQCTPDKEIKQTKKFEI